MNIKNLQFNNNNMTLHVKSNAKIHRIQSINRTGNSVNTNLVEVALLNEHPVFSEPSDIKPLATLIADSKSGFYLKSNGLFYALYLATTSDALTNEFLGKNPATALMATDNDGYHYITSLYSS
jgi:hypothetical protein